MKYLFLFAPSFILVNILTVFMRNNNLPHIAMMSTIFSGVVNIILDALFLFPLGMGMEGAVLATCIASVLSLSILTYSIMRHPGELRLMKKPLSFVIIKEIFTVGLPTFIIEICSGIVIFLFNSVLLEQAGTMGVSAYGIIANIALMAMAVFNGIGQGIQPLISINYASNQMTRVHTIKRLALATATGVGILFYSVGYFMRDQLAGLFISNDTALLELASSAIPYYFIAFLLVGFNLIAGYYFQAVTRPRISIIISLSRGLLFILLGFIFLPKYLGMIGIWLVVPFAEAATLLGLGVFLLITSKRIALQ